MTPKRWQQIEALCGEALHYRPDERRSFLARTCGIDVALRMEIERLLAVDDAEVSFLDEPLLALPSHTGEQETQKDEQIGPYRIVRPIGHGGMGNVYLAERDDGTFRRQVALKLIRRGLDTDDLLRRFELERQILATFDHPNIARLLDGGTTEDGRPYLTMQYVAGVPITEYCDEHRLPVADRLRLFQTVCDAVHHAHQHLVVHRDLKPTNVLITEKGVVKLIDFGIAKLLNPEQSELLDPAPLGFAAPLTRPEQRLLTPEYAAPEQLRGQPVTTASDVYALGVLLYELLTGHRPRQLHGRGQWAVEHVFTEVEPRKPSSIVARAVMTNESEPDKAVTPALVSAARGTVPKRLRRQLQGDLDTVVLMAMRDEPERRYASAEQFGDEVRRHLKGLPVRARRDTLGYRTAKFVRRHWWGVSAAASIAALLIAFATVTSIQSTQVHAKSAEVERERNKAEEIAAFLEGLFEASDPYEEVRGDTLTARALLERGRARVEDDLSSEPAVQAQMMVVMARAYERLGLYDDGEALARQALARRRQLFGEEHLDVAESIDQLAFFLRRKGDYDAAEELYRQALAMRRRLQGKEHYDVARSLNGVATVLMRKGDYEAAEPLFREALALDRKLLDENDLDVAVSINDLALLLHYRRAYDEAAAHYREALALYREIVGEEHPEVATTLHNISILLRDQGDYEGADSLARQALTLRRQLLGEDHMLVANSLGSLASVLRARGEYDTALSSYRDALGILRQVLPEGHPRTAVVLVGLGASLTEQGEAEEAEPLLREALRIYLQEFGATHRLTARAKAALGACLTARARYDEAEPLLRDALEILQVVTPHHWEVAHIQVVLGRCLTALERYDEAVRRITEGHRTLSRHLAAQHPLVVQAEATLNQVPDLIPGTFR